MTNYLLEADIVDNLTDNRGNKALSANQGRVLKELIDTKRDIVSGTMNGTDLELTKDDGTKVIIDITALLADVKAMSGHYDVATQSLVITLSDTNTFSIPVANLLPVLTDSSIEGNGSGDPLRIAVSADANNVLARGTDGKMFVLKELPSTVAGNALTRENDDRLYVGILDEDDMVSDSDTKLPSQQSVKAYVDALHKARVYLSTDTFTPADANNPTTGEVLGAVTTTEVIVSYNKTNNENIVATHTWHIDKDNKITVLGTPAGTPNTISQDITSDSPVLVASTQAVKDYVDSKLVPNNIITQSYSGVKSIGTTASVINLFPAVVIGAGKKIKVDISVPARNDSNGWGGLFINLNAKINGTWYNLGNHGYGGGVMANKASMIGYGYMKVAIDLFAITGSTAAHSVQFELMGKSYTGTTNINGAHFINAATIGLNKGTDVDAVLEQNFTTIHIEEYI